MVTEIIQRERERKRSRQNFVLLFKLESTTEKVLYIKVEELTGLVV